MGGRRDCLGRAGSWDRVLVKRRSHSVRPGPKARPDWVSVETSRTAGLDQRVRQPVGGPEGRELWLMGGPTDGCQSGKFGKCGTLAMGSRYQECSCLRRWPWRGVVGPPDRERENSRYSISRVEARPRRPKRRASWWISLSQHGIITYLGRTPLLTCGTPPPLPRPAFSRSPVHTYVCMYAFECK